MDKAGPKDKILLTPEEIQQTAKNVKKLEPGYLPTEIFIETARLTTTPIIELVPLRKNDGDIEVLLLKRPNDDPTWPGMLHTPGTVLRATDVDGGFGSAFKRLYNKEIGFTPKTTPVQRGVEFHRVNRGVELANIFSIDLTDQITVNGKWYKTTDLPKNIVDSQIKFILSAVNAYRKED